MNPQAQAPIGGAPPDPMAQNPQNPPPQQWQQAPPPPQPQPQWHHPPPPPPPPQGQQWQQPGQPQQPMHCYPAQPCPCPPQYPPQAYNCYTQPQQQCYPPPQPSSCSPDPCSSAMEDYCKQVMRNAMGDQAGFFDEFLGKFGVEDTDFWKGALIGAAAVVLLTNDKVKDTLAETMANAGDLFKTGAGKVKEAATDSAEIVKDTVKGGADGFTESVAKRKAKKSDDNSEE